MYLQTSQVRSGSPSRKYSTCTLNLNQHATLRQLHDFNDLSMPQDRSNGDRNPVGVYAIVITDALSARCHIRTLSAPLRAQDSNRRLNLQSPGEDLIDL